MPESGRALRDEDGLEIVSAWIDSL
jgi:hypothetical protein